MKKKVCFQIQTCFLIWRKALLLPNSRLIDNKAEGGGADGDVDGGQRFFAEESSVETDGGFAQLKKVGKADAGGMDVAEVEELALSEKPKTVEQMQERWSRDDRHVEHTVVGNGVGGLPIARGVADTDGHDVLRESFDVCL